MINAVDLCLIDRLSVSSEKILIDKNKAQIVDILVSKFNDFGKIKPQGERFLVSSIPEMLEEIDPGNQQATDILIDCLNQTSQMKNKNCQLIILISYLGHVAVGNVKAFEALLNLLNFTDNSTCISIQKSVLYAMGKINPTLIKEFAKRQLNSSLEISMKLYWINILCSMDYENIDILHIIDLLVDFFQNGDENIQIEVTRILSVIASKIPKHLANSNIMLNAIKSLKK
ncbi:hypothetical protein NIES2101_33455 [Calothrix sp. HK-06]|nr:hypothetical protein NIES2101_33455 [Calothrix sp. HK-06]